MPMFFSLLSDKVQIRGTSQDPRYPGWLDVISYSLTNQSRNPRNKDERECTMLRAVDGASQELARARERGTWFRYALLDIVNEKNEGLKWIFKSVLINGYDAGAMHNFSRGGHLPAEHGSIPTASADFPSAEIGGCDERGCSRWQETSLRRLTLLSFRVTFFPEQREDEIEAPDRQGRHIARRRWSCRSAC
jgi:hypothetical protein